MTSPDKTIGPLLCICVCLCGPDNVRETLKVYKSALSTDLFSSGNSPTGTDNEKTESGLPRLLLSLYGCCIHLLLIPSLYASFLNTYLLNKQLWMLK